MMIPDKEIKELREELYSCVKPMFFFDDDPDGLSSFLIFYKAVGDGKGIPIKSSPILDTSLSHKATEFSPDKVFILDKAQVTQEFIDSLKQTPVVWLDHHTPVDLKGVKYFNPRVHTSDKHKPTSYWCYKAADNEDFLWIASVGCIGDWHIPDFIDKFIERYPDLLDKKYDDPGYVLFETKLGELVKIFSFMLKGKTGDVIKSMKVLTRIKSPYEILNQETPKGRFIYKRYEKIKKMYDDLLNEALSKKISKNVLLFKYPDNKTSFTADLSNELLHKHPDKVVIIAREKNGEFRCSLRSGKYKIAEILKKVLEDIDGYGGGHEYACGAGIKAKDFERFVEKFKDAVSK